MAGPQRRRARRGRLTRRRRDSDPHGCCGDSSAPQSALRGGCRRLRPAGARIRAIVVEPAAIVDVCRVPARRARPALRLPLEPVAASTTRRRASIEVVYHLYSYRAPALRSFSRSTRRATTRSCRPSRACGRRPTGTEREIYDLLGVTFDGPFRPAPPADARGLDRLSAAQGLRRARGVSRHQHAPGEPAAMKSLALTLSDGDGSDSRSIMSLAGFEVEVERTGARPRDRGDDPQHGAAAPEHARGAALRGQGRRRGDARGDPRRRLPAPLDREDLREGRLPRLHAVHRSRRLRRRDVLQPGLGHGVREARRHRGAEARRVLPRDRRRAQPHREPSAVGRHDGAGHRRDDAVLPRVPRAREDQRPARRAVRRAADLQLHAHRRRRLGSAARASPRRSLAFLDRFEPLLDEYNDAHHATTRSTSSARRRGGDHAGGGDQLQPRRARICAPRASSTTCAATMPYSVYPELEFDVPVGTRRAAARSATASTATSCASAR